MPLVDPSSEPLYCSTTPSFVTMIILLVSFIISRRLVVGYPKIVSVEHNDNAIYIFHIYIYGCN